MGLNDRLRAGLGGTRTRLLRTARRVRVRGFGLRGLGARPLASAACAVLLAIGALVLLATPAVAPVAEQPVAPAQPPADTSGVERVLGSVRQAWHAELASLREAARALAVHDETYEFLRRPNIPYVNAHHSPARLDALGVDTVLIVDLQGKPLFWRRRNDPDHRGFDDAAAFLAELPPLVLPENAPRGEPLLEGAVRGPRGSTLVSVLPVHALTRGGPPRGYLIFGRSLDAGGWRRIADQAPAAVRLLDADDAAVPPLVQQRLASAFVPVVLVESERVRGFMPVNDLRGRLLRVYAAELPRPLLEQPAPRAVAAAPSRVPRLLGALALLALAAGAGGYAWLQWRGARRAARQRERDEIQRLAETLAREAEAGVDAGGEVDFDAAFEGSIDVANDPAGDPHGRMAEALRRLGARAEDATPAWLDGATLHGDASARPAPSEREPLELEVAFESASLHEDLARTPLQDSPLDRDWRPQERADTVDTDAEQATPIEIGGAATRAREADENEARAGDADAGAGAGAGAAKSLPSAECAEFHYEFAAEPEVAQTALPAQQHAVDEPVAPCAVATPDAADPVVLRADRLRELLEQGRCTVHYQPQVHLETGEVVGVEALLRWRDDAGVLQPAAALFGPEAGPEAFAAATEFVLQRACADRRFWLRQLGRALPIGVNVGLDELRDPGFLARVMRVLGESDLAPAFLELEVPEAALRTQADAAVLERAYRLGLSVAIGGFRAVDAPIRLLTQVPLAKIKIARDLVAELPGEAHAGAVVDAIVAMGRSLGVAICAEGVERPEQADYLERCRCPLVQGWHYARAMHDEQFLELLQASGVDTVRLPLMDVEELEAHARAAGLA